MSVKPEVELIFTIAPMEKYVKHHLENGERYACVTVIDKLFVSMVWFEGSTNPKKIFLIARV